ncbi:FolC bifunctional protein [Thioalkalivibrio sp. K90mix]|uniref:bifunctional folylpolyglutamate synthase/dihydrofolate synthase n=1 Tax=unclassified Thioalkalivibrio TaxID=2621013 RepID=UPI000195A9C8|nr:MULTISPECIES: folylpolyglutamate synthase/dihydrofolate synthase family protein [unclassified Thioalkalivibrio]ADC71839.1 FolC bifunctional protein [Thioalkalivibrio sp. K90mix]
MRYATLAEWLAFQERLHPVGMDLTLERIALVADRLGLRGPGTPRTVMVAGTNGKGTVTTRTAALLQAQGLKVGLFTSPHLLQYNERIRLNGMTASDEDLCRAFEAIDQARGDDSLTYFEFAALAAAWLFREARVDVQVLEVGLGGRLDAVNIWDADVAAVTAVDLDHQAWLGDSREVIGREKAGIMRAGRPVVLGELSPPQSVLDHARALGCRTVRLGRDFDLLVEQERLVWRWNGVQVEWNVPLARGLSGAALANTATALAVVESLGMSAGLSAVTMEQGLKVRPPGRLQRLSGPPEWLLDVAHNAQAVAELARWLRENPLVGPTVALVAVMADKDRSAMWRDLDGLVDIWIPVPLDLPRALPAPDLAAELEQAGQADVRPAAGIRQALQQATDSAGIQGRCVVFGSFHTVAAVFEQAPDLAAAALREAVPDMAVVEEVPHG